MSKRAEEGEIWEWRGFGKVGSGVAARISSYPVRMGLVDTKEHDIYFPSAFNDQNVKLRRVGSEWVLKFKVLLQVSTRSIELYRESEREVFELPVGPREVFSAAQLLSVSLKTHDSLFDRDGVIRAFELASPPIQASEVRKTRSQYQLEGGWAELAAVEFRRARLQSLSVHSTELEVVEGVLDNLGPWDGLEPMNYVEACRRWG